jgi:hypothetical protein
LLPQSGASGGGPQKPVIAWIIVKGFNPRGISGSAEWAGSSAWYADDSGQAEERPVCKPGKMV